MYKLFLLSILTLLIFSCKQDYSNPVIEKSISQKKNVVEIAPVQLKTDPVPIFGIGRVGTGKEVKLSFKIGGIISTINVDEGDYVIKDKLLAEVRANEIDAQVLKARRAVQKAERDLVRIKKMYADSAATLENVEDLSTLFEVTKADLEIAEFNQKYAKIFSPVSGRVIRRLAEPNELVSPGQPVFIVSSAAGSSYVMKVALSDRDINRVKYGSKAKVNFDAFPNEIFQASLTNIAENADPMTGTFEIELAIDANKKRLRNGFIGRVEISPILSEPYREVPLAAIVEGNDKGVYVFVPYQSDTLAKQIFVHPFHITSSSIYISDPEDFLLERIITTGAQYLEDGDRIYLK